MRGYRDPLAGLHALIEDERRRVDELTRRLTPMQRLALGPEWQQAEPLAAEARAALSRTTETVESASEVLRALKALEAALTDSVGRAARLLRCPTDAPDLGEAPRSPWRLLRRAVYVEPIARALVAPYKPAHISPWGIDGASARFRANGGHPLVLAVRASRLVGILEPTVRAIEIALLTSVPSCIQGVVIRSEERWHNFKSPSGRAGAFDATFVVSGDTQVAELLVDTPARGALLSLRALAPRVRIGRGVAEIGLTMPWEPGAPAPLPAGAVRFVTALRKRIGSASPSAAP